MGKSLNKIQLWQACGALNVAVAAECAVGAAQVVCNALSYTSNKSVVNKSHDKSGRYQRWTHMGDDAIMTRCCSRVDMSSDSTPRTGTSMSPTASADCKVLK